MLQTRVLRAAQGYVPLIKFKGHHNPPATPDHAPHPHPASPSPSLPDSFATYRQKSQQHGPLGGHGQRSSSSTSTTSSSSSAASSRTSSYPPNTQHVSAGGISIMAYGRIGGSSGRELGDINPPEGVAFSRNELPARFGAMRWEKEEMEAVESGGASLWG